MASDDTDFLLPSGDDLRIFLNQDSISSSLLRTILRHRGMITASTEKKDLVGYLLLSFLTPDEFELLLDRVRKKEDSQKVRSHTHSIATDGLSLSEMIPSEINLHSIAEDAYGNSKILGTPSFVFDPINSQESYVIRYGLERVSHSSDWISSRKTFKAEVRYTLDSSNKRLLVTTIHTAPETERANTLLTSFIKKDLKEKNHIEPEEKDSKIKFGSFTNEQRISFFMSFTGLNDPLGLSFGKLTDLSLKLDESIATPNEERLNWMREKVNRLRLSGDAIQDTFFVTDKACRPFVIFWKIEAKFNFDSADGKGTLVAIFEFADYGIKKSNDCEFQIAVSNLSFSRGSRGDQQDLKKKYLLKLNSMKYDFFEKSLRPPKKRTRQTPAQTQMPF